MSFVDLCFERGLRNFEEMKGFVKIITNGTVTRLTELEAGITPTFDFETLYNQAQPQFEAFIREIASTITPSFSSVVLKVYESMSVIDVLLISEDEIAGKPNYFEDFEYMGANTLARIEFSEDIKYFFHVIQDIDLKEEYYSLHGLPTQDIIAPENIAFAGLVYVAKKLLENNQELISSLLPVTEDFLPLIYASGHMNNTNNSFVAKLFTSDELYAKYYPVFSEQRSHFNNVIEYLNTLEFNYKIPMYLNLILLLNTEDPIFLEGTDMTFEHDRGFIKIPSGKPIELFRVATPYEYLQEFLKLDLIDETIRYIENGSFGDSTENSIAMKLMASLQLDGFPNPFVFIDSVVDNVNDLEVIAEGLTLTNPQGYSIKAGRYYDISFNAFTNEIIYAELG